MYSVIRFSNGTYAVKVGRTNNKRFKYLTDSVSEDKKQVEQLAEYHEAIHQLDKIETFVKSCDIKQARKLAQLSDLIQRVYEDRAMDEDPEFDEDDRRSYLC